MPDACLDRPRLALTLGDPAGIGPEIVVKALLRPEVREAAGFVCVGPRASLLRARELYAPDLDLGEIAVESVDDAPASAFPDGVVSAAAGRAAVLAVERAVRLALDGRVDAVVTAPLNKEAMHLAGYRYPGHTEILGELCGAKATMLLASPRLRVVHVSVHCSLREAISRVTRERVRALVDVAQDACIRLGIPSPRIAVAGLNPHAGEGGLFGDEDDREIRPAVEEARAAGLDASGPWPPDTVFLRASQGEWDIVVAMYHDQGHIAVKMLGLEGGVNVTLGLPILRTSVDHGTAFDIAWQGRAQADSMEAAIRMALRMLRARRGENRDGVATG